MDKDILEYKIKDFERMQWLLNILAVVNGSILIILYFIFNNSLLWEMMFFNFIIIPPAVVFSLIYLLWKRKRIINDRSFNNFYLIYTLIPTLIMIVADAVIVVYTDSIISFVIFASIFPLVMLRDRLDTKHFYLLFSLVAIGVCGEHLYFYYLSDFSLNNLVYLRYIVVVIFLSNGINQDKFKTSINHIIDKRTKSLREINHRLVDSMRFIVSGRLFSIVLHDVKNQLLLITLNSAIAQQNRDNETGDSAFGAIDGVVQNSVRIMNSFLEYIKLDATKKDVVDIGETISDAISYVRRTAESSTIKINFKKHGNAETVFLLCSRYRLLSSFLNIMTNAIQHLKTLTIPNKVLDISYEILSAKVIITISNNGDAIPEEIIENIFSTYTDKKGGSGIGLYFTYDYITNSLNGELKVIEPSDGGAAFVFTIPRQKIG